MSARSRLSALLRWVLSVLHRVLSESRLFLRHPSRLLYFLLAFLNRRSKPKGPSGGQPERITHVGKDSSWQNPDDLPICASAVLPRRPQNTSAGLTPHNLSQPNLSGTGRHAVEITRSHSSEGISNHSPDRLGYELAIHHPRLRLPQDASESSHRALDARSLRESISPGAPSGPFHLFPEMHRSASQTSTLRSARRSAVSLAQSDISTRRSRLPSMNDVLWSNKPLSDELVSKRASRSRLSSSLNSPSSPSRQSISSSNEGHALPAGPSPVYADVPRHTLSKSTPSIAVVPPSLSGNTMPVSDHTTLNSGCRPDTSSPTLAAPSGSTAIPLEYERHTIFPITPKWSQRYSRVRDMPTVEVSTFSVPAMSEKFPRGVDLPTGWAEYVHPEGAPYFYNAGENVITDSWIYDQDIYEGIKYSTEMVRLVARNNGQSDLLGAGLVLEIFPSEDSMVCGYYFVNHKHQCLFWVETFNAEYLLTDVHATIEPSHFNHVMETQYWLHRDYFPALYRSDASSVRDLKKRLRFSFGDMLTSATSTVAWDTEKLKGLVELIDQIDLDSTDSDPYAEVLLARASYEDAQWRWLHFHGEKFHRLDRVQTLHQSTVKGHSLFLRFLSPLLFSAPDVHMKSLQQIFVDRIVIDVDWKVFIQKLNKEWQDFLLLGEVLLTANLSFLAIQSVDLTNEGGNAPPDRSATQLACYVSMVFTIGSIILGLLLVRQNRTKTRNTAPDGAAYLEGMSATFLGLETVAIIFSLPHALLLWGFVSFTAAFCSMCLTNTSLYTRTIVGVPGSIVLFLIGWCIWASWESQGFWGPLWESVYEKLKKSARGRWKASFGPFREAASSLGD